MNARNKLLDNSIPAVENLCIVERNIADVDAKFAASPGNQVIRVRAGQHSLCGNAPPVQAHAAEFILLYQDDLSAKLRRANRGHVTPWSAPDDYHVCHRRVGPGYHSFRLFHEFRASVYPCSRTLHEHRRCLCRTFLNRSCRRRLTGTVAYSARAFTHYYRSQDQIGAACTRYIGFAASRGPVLPGYPNCIQTLAEFLLNCQFAHVVEQAIRTCPVHMISSFKGYALEIPDPK